MGPGGTKPMRPYDYYLGIDPGTQTGLAMWDYTAQQYDEIMSGTLIEMLERILWFEDIHPDFSWQLRIEDARQRKWYGKNAQAKIKGAGSIERDCSIWEEICEFHQWEYEMVHPIKGGTKWDAKTFKTVTGWSKQTNEHQRDAAMLVYGL